MVLLLSSLDIMMSAVVAFIGTAYFFGVLFVIVALIVLIVRRVKAKKNETFEKRDN